MKRRPSHEDHAREMGADECCAMGRDRAPVDPGGMLVLAYAGRGDGRLISPDDPEVVRAVDSVRREIRRMGAWPRGDDPCPRLIQCGCGGYGYQAKWGHAPYCARCGSLM